MPEYVEIRFEGGPFDGDVQMLDPSRFYEDYKFVRLDKDGSHFYVYDKSVDPPVFRYKWTAKDDPERTAKDAPERTAAEDAEFDRRVAEVRANPSPDEDSETYKWLTGEKGFTWNPDSGQYEHEDIALRIPRGIAVMDFDAMKEAVEGRIRGFESKGGVDA